MKKEFYTGQPLILKNTGEKVVFLYDDGDHEAPCYVLKEKTGKQFYHDYYDYDELQPSTEFTFSQIIAGLEQGYFEEDTEFETNELPEYKIRVSEGMHGLYLIEVLYGSEVKITSGKINSTWRLVEPRKEMTLEEIESELGYKIKLIENSKETLPMDWI